MRVQGTEEGEEWKRSDGKEKEAGEGRWRGEMERGPPSLLWLGMGIRIKSIDLSNIDSRRGENIE